MGKAGACLLSLCPLDSGTSQQSGESVCFSVIGPLWMRCDSLFAFLFGAVVVRAPPPPPAARRGETLIDIPHIMRQS